MEYSPTQNIVTVYAVNVQKIQNASLQFQIGTRYVQHWHHFHAFRPYRSVTISAVEICQHNCTDCRIEITVFVAQHNAQTFLRRDNVATTTKN